MHIPQSLSSMRYVQNDKSRMLNQYAVQSAAHQEKYSYSLRGNLSVLSHNGKGYPDRALFKARMDTPPLHSLGLTVKDEEQADWLRLTGQKQGERSPRIDRVPYEGNFV